MSHSEAKAGPVVVHCKGFFLQVFVIRRLFRVWTRLGLIQFDGILSIN